MIKNAPRLIDAGHPLAKYNSIGRWSPQVGDFIIWHGWVRRWYGVITDIEGDTLYVIKDGLPKLLFTMPQMDHKKNTVIISAMKVRTSGGGEYHILQDGVWFVD